MPSSLILSPVWVAYVLGSLCLGAMAVHLWVIRPRLRALGATRTALALSGIITGAIPVSLGLIAVLPDSRPGAFLLDVACMGWLGTLLSPRLLVRLSGGPSPAFPHAELMWHAEPLWRAVTTSDAMKAAAIAASLPPGTTEESREYAALWRRLAAEVGRIPIDNERVWPIAKRLRDLERELAGSHILSRKLSATLLLLVAAIGGIPPAIDYALTGEPCAGAEWLLLAGRLVQTPSPAPGPGTTIGTTLINVSGTLREDRSMGIEDAAASRGYFNAQEVLERYGFIAAVRKVYQQNDGALIQTDVFEFADADGAHDWQAAINRAACQFSNETFLGPGQGLGLQMRRQNPDFRIVEQVSWVVGNRRFVISQGFREPPPDHETILTLAHRAARISAGGDR